MEKNHKTFTPILSLNDFLLLYWYKWGKGFHCLWDPCLLNCLPWLSMKDISIVTTEKKVEAIILIHKYSRRENINIIMPYRIGSITEMALHGIIIFHFIKCSISISLLYYLKLLWSLLLLFVFWHHTQRQNINGKPCLKAF